MQSTPLINWSNIHHVLLDMDGTLLDLHFDNYFWQTFIPQRYAEQQKRPLSEVEPEFTAHCEQIRGTLNWYCLDYWSRTLAMDIPLLKEEVAHLIAEHPHVIPFLQALQHRGLRTVLVTNAHRASINLKMRHTRLADNLDKIISAHDLGLPKEDPDFWQQLQTIEPFNPIHTLLIDDSLPVLYSAQQYGIAHLLCVKTPDTKKPAQHINAFPCLSHFEQIMPPS